MKRLELLKNELNIIKGLRVLNYDLIDKAVEYYEHEIECIEKYGSDNPDYNMCFRENVTLTNEQAVTILESAHDDFVDDYSAEFMKAYEMAMEALKREPLSDTEQRIFLSAMIKEENVCRNIDKMADGGIPSINLVKVCKSIEKKVKKALWK